MFVGRASERAVLTGRLDAAAAGRGTTALIAGEPGIGKSRLATEVVRHAIERGFEVLRGRSLDLVGTDLPYQPFLDALRSIRAPRTVAVGRSQLRLFEDMLSLLAGRAARTPVLLVLEDLHWADASTLDLVVFLAHNITDHRLLLLGTCRADEVASGQRMRHLADRVQRSGAALVLELGPLTPEDLRGLLTARAGGTEVPAPTVDAIVSRSGGNPFFAEELLAAADDEFPGRVRDLLLRRVSVLDSSTQDMLGLIAAAGRDVSHRLLYAAAAQPQAQVRESLRLAVECGVLVVDGASGCFRFRHALLAEAIYLNTLPGDREDLHGRLADGLTRCGAESPAERASHWTVAGRNMEALTASIEAARAAQAVFGLAEAAGHLDRSLRLWPTVPDGARPAGLDLVELCAWAAELSDQTGRAPRAVELARRAIELTGTAEPLRAALLHERLAAYLHASGRADATLAALQHAVELVPAAPPSVERARVLAALAYGLNLAWRLGDVLPVADEAIAVARATGAHPAETRALTAAGSALVYLGRPDEGLARLRQAVDLAEVHGDPTAVQRAYVMLTDALTTLGLPRESARTAADALQALRPYGIDTTTLVANHIEALLAIGAWDEADNASAAALRAITGNYPHMPLIIRADIETGRGRFDDARAHLAAARATLRVDRDVATYDGYVAGLKLWEGRWLEAADAVQAGLARADFNGAAPLRVWLCAQGIRAHAELAALARAHRRPDAASVDAAHELLHTARAAAAHALTVTPNAGGWLAVAEAEFTRATGTASPDAWDDAASAWDRLERPPLAAYCRWRQAEALVASAAPRTAANGPLRTAYGVAVRIGAQPLVAELERLARRARLQLQPTDSLTTDSRHAFAATLGLTEREAEVLTLVARGCTNREIAATLVISAKTASVHVSHILRKLNAPNRIEAAAIAHRITPIHARSHALALRAPSESD